MSEDFFSKNNEIYQKTLETLTGSKTGNTGGPKKKEKINSILAAVNRLNTENQPTTGNQAQNRINPDGSPLLTSSEQEILDSYVESMKKVWKSKDPEERANLMKEVLAESNTKEFRPIYAKVLEQIKSWAPNIDMLSYKEWKPEVAERVNKWIKIVLEGNDPRTVTTAPTAASVVGTVNDESSESVAKADSVATASTVTASEDDLPF